jgi:hypothetical protein
MKTKMGRPRLSRKGVAVVFAVRLSPEQARTIKTAIGASGKSKPEWLRTALISAATRR